MPINYSKQSTEQRGPLTRDNVAALLSPTEDMRGLARAIRDFRRHDDVIRQAKASTGDRWVKDSSLPYGPRAAAAAQMAHFGSRVLHAAGVDPADYGG